VDCYLDNPRRNGVWISGFFRLRQNRHLLKILIAAARQRAARARTSGRLTSCLPKVEDEIIQANLRKAITTVRRAAVPVQHSNQSTTDWRESQRPDPGSVSEGAERNCRGITATRGYIARFEHDSTSAVRSVISKKPYLRLNGRQLGERPRGCANRHRRFFCSAYAEQFSTSSEEAMR